MCRHLPITKLVVCGGVAANQYLRTRLEHVACDEGVEATFPSLDYCTDNGAMIGYVGALKLMEGKHDPLLHRPDRLDSSARWALDLAHVPPLGL